MKQPFLLLVLLLTSTAVLAQRVVLTEPSAKHQKIPGTRVSMVLPPDFSVSNMFLGLEGKNGLGTVMVFELSGAYTETVKDFTSEKLKNKGQEILKQEPLFVNWLPGKFIKTSYLKNGAVRVQYYFITGNEKQSLLILGNHPNLSEEKAKELEAALFSTLYDPEKTLDPFEPNSYSLNLNGTGLKYATNIFLAITFNKSGEYPNKSEDRSALVASEIPYSQNVEDEKEFVEKNVRKTFTEVISVAAPQRIVIDGVKGYEITAEGKIANDPQLIKTYQVVLFGEERAYFFIGTTNTAFEQNLATFKQAVQTFKRK